ncbi:hypothetical protein K466DRAFT_219196, partial [Polyporus arcularius HHB13444]
PHEQSVGGALFQTLTQLGTAFGLAISTVVYNATLKKSAAAEGVTVNVDGTNAPRDAQLTAYKDANWTGFAFAMVGALLAVIFLRGVGVVGHRGSDADSEKTAREDPEDRDHDAVRSPSTARPVQPT